MAVTKRGESWQVRVRDVEGNWLPAETFPTKAQAIARESELMVARNKGRKRMSKTARDMLFEDYWEKWSSECRENVSVGWQKSQDQMMRDYIMPTLRVQKLVEIDRSDIAKILKKAADKGLGDQMRIHIFNLLHKMFVDAIEYFEILDSSPVRLSLKPAKPKVIRSFMKPEEARRFLAYVADDYIGPAIWIMMLCGLRIGELQGLQWKNVDLSAGVLFIARQWKSKVKAWGLPKNKEPIRVPMPPDLVDYLSSKKPLDVDPESVVMKSQKDGGRVHYDTIEDGIKRLCAAGNFTVLTPHELRHTCSELWIESGATKEDIRRLFNHRSEASTDPYIHKTNERLERISQGVRLGNQASHLRVVK